MGIGMVLICSPYNVDKIMKALPEAKVIGEVVKLAGKARVIIRSGGLLCEPLLVYLIKPV